MQSPTPPPAADRFALSRFVSAQSRCFDDVVAELEAGRKCSHWMWFVFPQVEGLGRSETSRHYAIRSLNEARAYLAHPLLGERLRQCVRRLLDGEQGSAEAIFGGTDARKLQSSMTLFSLAGERDCDRVLERFFAGRECGATRRALGG